MHAVNLQFCKLMWISWRQSFTYSQPAEMMYCVPAVVFVWVSDKLPKTSMYVLYHNYTIKDQVLQLDLGLLDLATWLHEEDTWLRGSDSFCGATTAVSSIKVQTLLPRETSRPLIGMITELGSLEWEPTTELDAVTDVHINRASSAYLPQTSPP